MGELCSDRGLADAFCSIIPNRPSFTYIDHCGASRLDRGNNPTIWSNIMPANSELQTTGKDYSRHPQPGERYVCRVIPHL